MLDTQRRLLEVYAYQRPSWFRDLAGAVSSLLRAVDHDAPVRADDVALLYARGDCLADFPELDLAVSALLQKVAGFPRA